MKRILVFTVVLFLVSCVTPQTQRGEVSQADVEREAALQKEIFYQNYMENVIRLSTVAYPILVNNASLCKEKIGSNFGMLINSPRSAGKEFAETFKALYGRSEDARITGIVKNGPAELAGVKIGDAVKSIDGKAITKTNERGMAKLIETMREITPGTPTVFALERSGQPLQIEVTPVRACDYPVVLLIDNTLNAFADGEAIYMTKGMMRFVNNDNELALIIGHELAHNTMGHIDAKRTNLLLGSIFDVIAAGYGIDTQNLFGKMGANAYSQGFESEADYVGLYYIERSGFEISDAPTFWRRMAAEHPGSIKNDYNSTHPSTAERFVQLENAIAEIHTKQRSEKPLIPNMKSK